MNDKRSQFSIMSNIVNDKKGHNTQYNTCLSFLQFPVNPEFRHQSNLKSFGKFESLSC